MRTIKFRGKRIDNGEWVYGYYYYAQKSGQHFIVNEEWEGCAKHERIDPETICQFTGLQDKNGKDIYEGYILASLCHDVIFTVCFGECENSMATFFFDKNGRKYVMDKSISSMVIIGNVYENPELLNK